MQRVGAYWLLQTSDYPCRYSIGLAEENSIAMRFRCRCRQEMSGDNIDSEIIGAPLVNELNKYNIIGIM